MAPLFPQQRRHRHGSRHGKPHPHSRGQGSPGSLPALSGGHHNQRSDGRQSDGVAGFWLSAQPLGASGSAPPGSDSSHRARPRCGPDRRRNPAPGRCRRSWRRTGWGGPAAAAAGGRPPACSASAGRDSPGAPAPPRPRGGDIRSWTGISLSAVGSAIRRSSSAGDNPRRDMPVSIWMAAGARGIVVAPARPQLDLRRGIEHGDEAVLDEFRLVAADRAGEDVDVGIGNQRPERDAPPTARRRRTPCSRPWPGPAPRDRRPGHRSWP